MKILCVCSTLDLRHKLGCTPVWWQLFKALHELNHEIIAVPYLGYSVESPWWRVYENPCLKESLTYRKFSKAINRYSLIRKSKIYQENITRKLANFITRGKWERHIDNILKKERNVNAVVLYSIPLNQIKGLPNMIKEKYGIPVFYFDGDMPVILPSYADESVYDFSYYVGADVSEFDAFLSNSKGAIPELESMGAKNVHELYFAADSDLFQPIEGIEKTCDVSFFGYGSEFRRKWMRMMIKDPSVRMSDKTFIVGGGGFNVKLGRAKNVGDVPFSDFRRFCCQSRINLNITRKSHAELYASSTARIFELAALGCVIVSNPLNGVEEWFKPGKELIMLDKESTPEDIAGIYQNLLEDEDTRTKISESVRQKVLEKHTYRHRAQELIDIISKI